MATMFAMDYVVTLDSKKSDRQENIRRVREIAKLFVEAGAITLIAFISPFQEDRNSVRNLFPHGDFLEIFCHCSVETCEQRDVKGLYKRARAGEIKDFTGINSPYEAPENPELVVETDQLTLEESVNKVMGLLLATRGIVNSSKENP